MSEYREQAQHTKESIDSKLAVEDLNNNTNGSSSDAMVADDSTSVSSSSSESTLSTISPPTTAADSLKEEQQPEQNNNHPYGTTTTTTNFVSRVTSIPIVQDSVSTFQAMANKTKFTKYAISTVNSTLYNVVNKTTATYPTIYEQYIQPHIEKADELGCRSLDLIQNKFPVVNQPTPVLYDKVIHAPPVVLVDTIKVRLDNSIKQPAIQAVKDANDRFGHVVDNLEAVLDHYLPTAPATTSDSNTTGENDNGEKNDPVDINQLYRAYSLLNSTKTRIARQISTQVVKYQIPQTREELFNRVVESSVLLQKVTENAQQLQDTIIRYLQEQQQANPVITTMTDHLHTVQKTSQERISYLSEQLACQLQTLITSFNKIQTTAVEKTTAAIPASVKNRIGPIIHLVQERLEAIRAQYYSSEAAANINNGKSDNHSTLSFTTELLTGTVKAINEQVMPLLKMAQSQLNHYADMAATHEFKLIPSFNASHQQQQATA